MTNIPYPYGVATMPEDSLVARLRRIEGQVRGLTEMVRNDEECLELLNLVKAIKGAVDQVGLGILRGHVARCLVDAAREEDERSVERILEAVDRFAA
jgi:DNA-binding FrmR family transcriptional regulator